MEIGVAATTFKLLVAGVCEVVDEDFLRQRQRPIKAVASNFDVTWKGGVDTLDEFYRGSCTHRSHVDNYNTSS
jgi:hypothetical protein